MTFAEFDEWCNERANDGRWGFCESIFCSTICKEILKKKFLFNGRKKREELWHNHPDRLTAEEIVKKTNKLIKLAANK